jgi:hypothetical protein
MKIEKVQDIKSQKGYKFNNQFFVAYEGNSQFDANNQDYLACLEFIKNGGKLEPEFTPEEYLKRAKDNKLAELNNFHASEVVKIFTIKLANGASTKISVDADTRYLLDEQISLLNFKKMQGEADPKWLYQNGIDMPLNLTALIGIRLYIGALVDANFKAKKIHEKAIANLKTIEEIEKYDLKIGYRLNQILSF